MAYLGRLLLLSIQHKILLLQISIVSIAKSMESACFKANKTGICLSVRVFPSPLSPFIYLPIPDISPHIW